MRRIATVVCLACLEIAAAAGERAAIRHVPPGEATEGVPLRLVASVDDAWTESALELRWRPLGSGAPFAALAFERSSAGGWFATIPGAAMVPPGIEYWIAGEAASGSGEVAHFASAAVPHAVRVELAPAQRWAEVERARVGGRASRLRARMAAASFGTAEGPDWMMRGEVDWTHRLVKTLYSFSLGYGFIQGVTPEMRGAPDLPGLEHGARYGFGEIRWRLHELIWVDTGVLLGFSHDGLATGARANLTLGKEWRSCVQLGAEVIDGLGPSAWLRLQWDTVPPLLMGAEIRATDLPGARLDGGMMLTYDVAIPIGRRVTLGAQVSYAARAQKVGSFGGGLSSAFEF
jgi:hypothetical protein